MKEIDDFIKIFGLMYSAFLLYNFMRFKKQPDNTDLLLAIIFLTN